MVLTKLKMAPKHFEDWYTYTEHLSEVMHRKVASQVREKVLGHTPIWEKINDLTFEQVFDQIESSLREIYDAD